MKLNLTCDLLLIMCVVTSDSIACYKCKHATSFCETDEVPETCDGKSCVKIEGHLLSKLINEIYLVKGSTYTFL